MNGTCRLGTHIFKRVAKSKHERIEKEKAAAKEAQEAHLKIVEEARKIKDLGLADAKLSSNHLLTLIKALRRKTDGGALPSKKAERFKLYLEWKGRDVAMEYQCAVNPVQSPPIEDDDDEAHLGEIEMV